MAGGDRYARAAAAFVTGCSSGIGEALAEELADRGWVRRPHGRGRPAPPGLPGLTTASAQGDGVRRRPAA